MPDESCRSCGGNLANCTLCAECKEVTSLICKKCGTITKDQFHSFCMYHIEDIQTRGEMSMTFENSNPKIISIA